MKKVLLVVIALLISHLCPAAETIYSQSSFSGFMDQYFADDIGTTNASSMLNVQLDEYTGAITKRQGCQADNITPLPGNLWVRNLYNYRKIDGSEYRVAQSSCNVALTGGDGTYTIILSTMDSLARFDFTTAKNTFYGCNGYCVFKSTGVGSQLSTVYSSTGVPTGATLMKWINNRMYYSGIPATPSIIWYSELNDPDNVQPLNYLNINVSDGDSITGLFGFQLTPFCTKKFSTWQFPEVSVGVFQVRPISQTIGCLYESTMQTYLGQYPMWLSSRGVEMYDGQFELVSQPINNTILSLRQMNTAQSVLQQDTAADWGAGSGVNIDTTTYPGSVAMAVSTWTYGTANINQQCSGTVNYALIPSNGVPAWQSFRTSATIVLTNITLSMGTNGTPNDGISVSLSTSSTGAGALYTHKFNDARFYSNNYPQTPFAIDFSTQSISLTAEATYYIVVVTTNTANQSSHVWFSIYGGGYYPRGISSDGASDALFSVSGYVVHTDSASFTTQSLAAVSWGSWGTFSVNDSQPTNSSILYQIVTATSAYNLGTNAPISIVNGGNISSAVGPYIAVKSSYTRTDSSVIPMTNSYKITYSGGNNMIPCSAIYKDRYYLAVSTDNTNGINDTLLVFDKNQQWTRHSGHYGSMCLYRQSLYHGDSTIGQVYADDVTNLFTDNGVAYDSYYASKIFDFREDNATNSLLLKDFMEFWTRMYANAPGTINVNYRLDGSQGVWTTLAPMTYSAGVNVTKLQFPAYPKSKMIQFMYDDNYGTNYFNIKGLFSVYQTEPRQ